MPNKTVTVNGATIDNGQSPPFGTGCGKFVAASSQYLSLADSDDWYFTGDFTIDLLVKFNTLPSSGNTVFLGQFQDGSHYFYFYMYTSDGVYWSVFGNYNGTTVGVKAGVAFVTGTWYQIELCRYGNLWSTAVNGVFASWVSNALTLANLSASLDIAQFGWSGGYLDGWLKAFRISKGIARNTSNFTPPTTAYTTDSYTVLLLQMETNFNDTEAQSIWYATGSASVSAHAAAVVNQAAKGTALITEALLASIPKQTAAGSASITDSLAVKVSQKTRGSALISETESVKVNQQARGSATITETSTVTTHHILQGSASILATLSAKLNQAVHGSATITAAGTGKITRQQASGQGQVLASGQSKITKQLALGAAHVSESASTVLNQAVHLVATVTATGSAQITRQVARGYASISDHASLVLSQVSQGYATIHARAIARLVVPFNGLIGHASATIRVHLPGASTRNQAPTGGIRDHQTSGEES